jgi:hypothetical protein
MTYFPLQLLRVKKCGGSLVLALPRHFREAMNLSEGDWVAIRIHAPFATLRRCDVQSFVKVDDIPAAALPPATIKRGTDA